MSDIYPCLIFRTRYGGVYEGGAWAATNAGVIPDGAEGSDPECSDWWGEAIANRGVYGREPWPYQRPLVIAVGGGGGVPGSHSRGSQSRGAGMTAASPTRSPEQRQEALTHANRVRFARSALKQHVKAGAVNVTDVLADPPGYVMSMRVRELLLAIPKVGPVKTSRILRRAAVSNVKTVGGISEQQRDRLLAELTRVGVNGQPT